MRETSARNVAVALFVLTVGQLVVATFVPEADDTGLVGTACDVSQHGDRVECRRLTASTALAIGTAMPSTLRVVWDAPPPKPTRTPAAPVLIRCSAAV